jgi:carboxymethylenebutenolidase
MCLFDECKSPARREFLIGAAAAGVASLAAREATAAAPSAVAGAEMRFPSSVGMARGYLARPRHGGRHSAVLVLHAELGLPDWTKAVADELAGAGFVALTVACFSRIKGFTQEQLRADGQGARRYLSESFFQEVQTEAHGALSYLRHSSAVRRGPIGIVGFCGGGIKAVRLALAAPEIGAVVSFYGPPALPAQYKHPTDPIVDLVDVGARLRTPLQIHYGTADYAVKAADVARLADEVRSAGTPVEVHAYEGATHAFYDRREPPANALAARAAHDSYLRFLKERLG